VIEACVYDKEKDEPIPFATVGVQGTSIGTVTNYDGCFKLVFSGKITDTLVVSTLGFNTRKYPVNQIKQKGQKLLLSAADLFLEEITIMAGENPALPIMDSVISNRIKHDHKLYNNYSYEQYAKVELDLTNINSENLTDNIWLKKFDFVTSNIDSTSEQDPFLPIFLTETLSDYYYSSNPVKRKERIKANKVSGLKNAAVTQFLGSMYQDVNIYKDYINIAGKGFISPIANIGNNHYKYYRVDSGLINDHFCYKIQFLPKKKQENVFVGDMWLTKTDWSVKQINMSIAGSANINYVNKVSLFQSFEKINQKWIINKDKLVIHFLTKNEKRPGIIGRKTSSYKNHKINDTSIATLIERFGDVNQIVKQNSAAEELRWQLLRHDSLNENEQKVYAMIDTLQNLPMFKTYVDIVKTFFSGFYQLGPISLGPYFNLLSTDQVEGWRFAFGARTNERMFKNFRTGFYAAYGLRDKRFKWASETKYILNDKRWTTINYRYQNDLDLINDDISEVDNDNIVAGLMQKNIEQRLIFLNRHFIKLDREWQRGLWTSLTFDRKWQSPYFDFQYLNENNALDSTILTSDIGLSFRFSRGEKFVNTPFSRISLGGKSPIWYININKGIKGFLEGQFNYVKVKLRVADQQPIYPLGYLRYQITAGKTFGQVPYLLLEVPKGNFTYYFNPNAFNSMNPYEFATDEFIQINMTHYLDGAILNKIPLMRKLKCRGLWSAKVIMGRYNFSKRGWIDNRFIKVLNNDIYAESSLGVENIFKLIRLDMVYRWTHLEESSNYPISKLGVYASVQFKL